MSVKGILSIAVFFFLYSNASLAVADDFQVMVLEKGSRQAVEGATVVLEESDVFQTSANDGVVTFKGETLPKYFKVLAEGYETKIWKVKGDPPNFKIYLQPLVYEADGLEVVAERIKEKGSKVALTRQELTLAPGSQGDPLKTIISLPGVVAAGDGMSEVYMRGSGTDENIVWINRAPVGYLYHFGGWTSSINPHLIEDLNVFLAGFPVEYGDALGGAIDARLRKPETDRMHYKFDISTMASSFLVEGPIGKAGGNDSFFLAGRRSYIDLVFSPDAFEDDSDDPDVESDKIIEVPRFYDIQALYNHKLPEGNIDFYFFSAGDELISELNETAHSDPQLKGQVDASASYKTIGSTWEQTWSESFSHSLNLAWIYNDDKLRFGNDENGAPFFAYAKRSGVMSNQNCNGD